MEWYELLMVAIGLGTDAFSVSIVAGCLLPAFAFRPAFRLSFHFGLFQAAMPVIGWYGGSFFAETAQGFARYLAAGLLAVVAARMFVEAVRAREAEEAECRDLSRGWSLVTLSTATSIDALFVGVGIGLMGGPIWFEAGVIGATASAMTMAGFLIGRRLGSAIGRRAEILGAVALAAIAVSIVLR